MKEDNDLLLNNPRPSPCCERCRFASAERPQPNVLQTVLICRWGPPTPVLIPTGPNAASVQPIWPAVATQHWCHRFEPLPPTKN